MDTIYQQYWDSLRKEKQSFWGMDGQITKKIPIIYPSDPIPLIDSIPREIKRANEIVEEANYFIFNGKKKVRKIPFLSQLLPKYLMPKEENTSGHLFLTIDPEWMLRCSDKEYTSWTSCFAPNGCYYFSAKEYTTSINIAMAMITNSDMTKIIGRKFVSSQVTATTALVKQLSSSQNTTAPSQSTISVLCRPISPKAYSVLTKTIGKSCPKKRTVVTKKPKYTLKTYPMPVTPNSETEAISQFGLTIRFCTLRKRHRYRQCVYFL